MLESAWRTVAAQVRRPLCHRQSGRAPGGDAVGGAGQQAYRQLRDPMLRARYLCEQAGVDLQTESNTSMDPAFLMQQMSWREALDDARGDAAALASLQAELQEARGQMRARLAQLLDVDKDYAAAGQKDAGMDVRGSWRRSWPTRNRRNSQGAGRPPPNLRPGCAH